MRIVDCRPAGAAWISLAAALATALALTWVLGAVSAGAADACPNEALRKEDNSTALPDCRAYELVSPAPAQTGGYDVRDTAAQMVSEDGDAIAWLSEGSFAGTPSAQLVNQYISRRSGSGWSTEAVEVPYTNPDDFDAEATITGWSADLKQTVVQVMVPGQPEALYLREADGALTLLDPGAKTDTTTGLARLFEGATPDFSRLVFEGPSGHEEWNEGKISSAPLVEVASRCTTGKTGESGPGGNCFTGKETLPWTDFDLPNGSLGRRAFFKSSAELTNDANTGKSRGGEDLYEYDSATGELTDVSSDSTATDENGATVQGLVGASTDGSYVYFVAKGVLTGGAGTVACKIIGVSTCNLYAWHEGTLRFIGALNRTSDLSNWNSIKNGTYAQVSADGAHLVFTSTIKLTDYENAGHSEIYLYDAESGKLSCVSCNPSGVPATAAAKLAENGGSENYVRHVNVSPDGQRVFFQTAEALLPQQDTSGAEEVYEWEADGAGSCESAAENGGCLYLISSGHSEGGSSFEGASPNGEDVFFATRQPLVGRNADSSLEIYDARVDGGFPAASATSPCAEVLACRGAQSSPAAFAPPGSELVSGAGNLVPESKSSASTPKPKPKLLTLTAHGTSFSVRVRVPGRGRLTISGKGMKQASRSVAGAGTYRLRLRLTRGSNLRAGHELRLKVRLRYVASQGAASSVSASLTVRPASKRDSAPTKGAGKGNRGGTK